MNKKLRLLLIIAIIGILTFMLSGCKKYGDRFVILKPQRDIAPSEAFLAQHEDRLLSMDEFYDMDDVVEQALFLWKLGSTNQQLLDYYTFFIDAGGSTDISGTLSGTLTSQSYHIKYYEYEFHQHINYITEATVKGSSIPGVEGIARSILDRASLTLDVYKSATLKDYYHFEGGEMESYNETNNPEYAPFYGKLLNTAKYFKPEMKTEEYTPFEKMKDGEINYITESSMIFYEDIIADANVEEAEDEFGNIFYKVQIIINVDDANGYDDIIAKLKNDTGANPVSYQKFDLDFEIWDSGLLKMWQSTESWKGKLSIVTGDTTSQSPKYYSYQESDARRILDAIKYVEELGDFDVENVNKRLDD